MKLIRFGDKGEEKPGLLVDGVRKDASDFAKDYNQSFFDGSGLRRLAAMSEDDLNALPDVPETARWGAPIARPGKIICIGLNYRDHAIETGSPIPTEPVVFFKATNTMVGPYDQVQIPRTSEQTDWEVELGVVIGKEARYLESEASAFDYVAGYTICHDVSERYFQKECGGQWVKGKSCDTFNPTGPWLATQDEIGDVQNLSLTLKVNGEQRQNGNTKTMIFGVPKLVHYLSQFMTLEAGDVISTGTPPGVGLGMKPPVFLKAGDVVELEIPGLGKQKQECINA